MYPEIDRTRLKRFSELLAGANDTIAKSNMYRAQTERETLARQQTADILAARAAALGPQATNEQVYGRTLQDQASLARMGAYGQSGMEQIDKEVRLRGQLMPQKVDTNITPYEDFRSGRISAEQLAAYHGATSNQPKPENDWTIEQKGGKPVTSQYGNDIKGWETKTVNGQVLRRPVQLGNIPTGGSGSSAAESGVFTDVFDYGDDGIPTAVQQKVTRERRAKTRTQIENLRARYLDRKQEEVKAQRKHQADAQYGLVEGSFDDSMLKEYDTAIRRMDKSLEVLNKYAKGVPKQTEDDEAVAWAKKNPNDPRAKRILQLNGAK